MKLFKRNIILNINRFQRLILIPVLIASSIACIISIICLIYLLADITETKKIGMIRFEDLQLYIPWLMMGISYLLLFVVFWTYYTSNKIVGPHERVIRELDETIAGKRKGPITHRPGDEMFHELLTRINVLIEKSNKSNNIN